MSKKLNSTKDSKKPRSIEKTEGLWPLWLVLLPPTGETGQDSGGSVGSCKHAKHGDIVSPILFKTGMSQVHVFF